MSEVVNGGMGEVVKWLSCPEIGLRFSWFDQY